MGVLFEAAMGLFNRSTSKNKGGDLREQALKEQADADAERKQQEERKHEEAKRINDLIKESRTSGASFAQRRNSLGRTGTNQEPFDFRLEQAEEDERKREEAKRINDMIKTKEEKRRSLDPSNAPDVEALGTPPQDGRGAARRASRQGSTSFELARNGSLIPMPDDVALSTENAKSSKPEKESKSSGWWWEREEEPLADDEADTETESGGGGGGGDGLNARGSAGGRRASVVVMATAKGAASAANGHFLTAEEYAEMRSSLKRLRAENAELKERNTILEREVVEHMMRLKSGTDDSLRGGGASKTGIGLSMIGLRKRTPSEVSLESVDLANSLAGMQVDGKKTKMRGRRRSASSAETLGLKSATSTAGLRVV